MDKREEILSCEVKRKLSGAARRKLIKEAIIEELPRLHILQENQKVKYESAINTLKRLSDTRWASRNHAVDAIVESLFAILETLEDINYGEKVFIQYLLKNLGLEATSWTTTMIDWVMNLKPKKS
ncbi:hypothetical protein HELRODRAFT_169205 [Helobdella robusta]|uniref:Uncharacterized protein n=1 Tax=Helobdella robusta TaxID=6412 RepID=T1F1K6_HELRO|nr:hypothetical protein HELRODRAFT_169205 [Helobdella robusta]ESO08383.1 hypothetical protein HELRODRAFT_169205 [Helobdella robusta]